MTTHGTVRANPGAWITLACGHSALYAPPLPNVGDELTCAVCFLPTYVTQSPRRWRA